jgi:hypothetical protein
MTIPTRKVELALVTKPTEAPTWIDVTPYLLELTSSRGRQYELDRFQAGTAQVVLDNSDRRFDPTYSGEIGNLVTNPRPDPGGSTTAYYGWVESGSVTVSNVADATDPEAVGSRSIRWVFATWLSCVGYVAQVSVIAGQQHRCLARLMATEDCRVTVDLQRDAAPWNVVSNQATIELRRGTWTQIDVRLTATASCAARYRFSFGSPTADLISRGLASDGTVTVYAHNLSVDPNARGYADGAMTECTWTGTAHQSTTRRGAPYYGSMKLLRRLRITATWNGATYPIFSGYIDAWRQDYRGHGTDHRAVLHAVDGFKVLALRRLTATYPSEMSGARIDRVLSDADWTTGASGVLDSATSGVLDSAVLGPIGDRSISAGQTLIQAISLVQVPALSHIQDVERAESGAFFIAADGTATFRSRHETLISADPRVTFGGADGEIGYADIDLEYDDTRIWNDIQVTRAGSSTTLAASDGDSQDDYFPRSYPLQNILIDGSSASVADAEAQAMAQYLVNRYKEAGLRVSRLRFDATGHDAAWQYLLGLELLDRSLIRHRPFGGEGTIEQLSTLERVVHKLVGMKWTVEMGWSASDSTVYSRLNDATAGVLGTAVLAY